MRTLALLRHAKAVRDGHHADEDRPLDPRGQRAARLVGAFLGQQPWAFTRVLCSSAERTRQTLDGLREGLPATVRVSVESDLYLASAGALLGRVNALDDAEAGVLLVGHNPGIADLALALAGGGDAAAYARMRDKFPTAALAVLEFDLEHWHDVVPGGGRLAAYSIPKDLV